MSTCIYTKAELVQKIKDLDDAIVAIQVNKSYELDTGQGRQKVTYQDIDQLLKLRELWVSELECLNGAGLMSFDTLSYKRQHFGTTRGHF